VFRMIAGISSDISLNSMNRLVSAACFLSYRNLIYTNFMLQKVKSMRYIADFADSKFSTRNSTECHGRKTRDDTFFKFAMKN
jgi:hypothetical protein